MIQIPCAKYIQLFTYDLKLMFALALMGTSFRNALGRCRSHEVLRHLSGALEKDVSFMLSL